MRNNTTHGSLAVALRSSTDHRRTFIAAMLCSVINAGLFNALVAVAIHQHSIVLLIGSIGVSECVTGSLWVYWMLAHTIKTA